MAVAAGPPLSAASVPAIRRISMPLAGLTPVTTAAAGHAAYSSMPAAFLQGADQLTAGPPPLYTQYDGSFGPSSAPAAVPASNAFGHNAIHSTVVQPQIPRFPGGSGPVGGAESLFTNVPDNKYPTYGDAMKGPGFSGFGGNAVSACAAPKTAIPPTGGSLQPVPAAMFPGGTAVPATVAPAGMAKLVPESAYSNLSASEFNACAAVRHSAQGPGLRPPTTFPPGMINMVQTGGNALSSSALAPVGPYSAPAFFPPGAPQTGFSPPIASIPAEGACAHIASHAGRCLNSGMPQPVHMQVFPGGRYGSATAVPPHSQQCVLPMQQNVAQPPLRPENRDLFWRDSPEMNPPLLFSDVNPNYRANDDIWGAIEDYKTADSLVVPRHPGRQRRVKDDCLMA